MDSPHHCTKRSTSWTTLKHTKDGDEQPSSDRKNGFTCNPSNRAGTSWSDFDPAPQNQITWADSSHLRVHPYPMQMRWTRRQDQGRKEDSQWLMMNPLRGISRIKNHPSPHATGITARKGRGEGIHPR